PSDGSARREESSPLTPAQREMIGRRSELPSFVDSVRVENGFPGRRALAVNGQNVIGPTREFLDSRVEWERLVHADQGKVIAQIDLLAEIVARMVVIDPPLFVQLNGHMPGGEEPARGN